MRTLLKGVCASMIAALLISGSAALVGCNTVEGAGKDVKNAGEGVKDAARDAKD